MYDEEWRLYEPNLSEMEIADEKMTRLMLERLLDSPEDIRNAKWKVKQRGYLCTGVEKMSVAFIPSVLPWVLITLRLGNSGVGMKPAQVEQWFTNPLGCSLVREYIERCDECPGVPSALLFFGRGRAYAMVNQSDFPGVLDRSIAIGKVGLLVMSLDTLCFELKQKRLCHS